MTIKKLFDFIYDQVNGCKNIQSIRIEFINSIEENLMEHVQLQTKDGRIFMIQTNFKLRYFDIENVLKNHVVEFDNINVLCEQLINLINNN